MGRDTSARPMSFAAGPERSAHESKGDHGGSSTSSSSRRPPAVSRALHNEASFGRNRFHGLTQRVAPYPRRGPRTRSVAKAEGQLLLEQEEAQASDSSLRTHAEGPKDQLLVEPWAPSFVIGSPLWNEGEDLSGIELADRKIAQRRAWVDFYGNSSHFSSLLHEAIEERERLDEGARENTTPRSLLASTHAEAIRRRIDVLRSVASESKFLPERANMEAAIAGYESGIISYSPFYTLIWAGRIVDRCPDHTSFTKDRKERLDRYLALYGEGWFWYEPPLTEEGGDLGRAPSMGKMKKGICLQNKTTWRRKSDGVGHYRIVMGFRRRREAVARGGHQASPATPTSLPQFPRIRPVRARPEDRRLIESDPDGPRLFFDMLLDCGATLPCLFTSDLLKLGINPQQYAAQAARVIATAESVSTMKIYELDVCVYPPHEPSEEEDEILAATIPVVILGHVASSDGHPETAPDRLSGLLPFHMCYFSSAPGRFQMWMGKNRRDVLGAGRLPGQMRLSSWKKNIPLLETTMLGTVIGTPQRVVFEHDLPDGSVVRDRDEGFESVIVTAPPGVDIDDADSQSSDLQVIHVLRSPSVTPGATWHQVRGEKKSAPRATETSKWVRKEGQS